MYHNGWYNTADVVPFIEAFRKMTGQYYPDKIDVKTQLVSQVYQWHTCWTSLWKKTKSFSYIYQEVFATYVEINGKSSSTVVVTVPWNMVVIVKNVNKICKPWKSKGVKRLHSLWAVEDRRDGRASASFYKVPWTWYNLHKISCVWRWCKCLISLKIWYDKFIFCW